MTLPDLPRTPWWFLSTVAQWHVTSQQTARRNALVASTALTQRRREQLDVEEFLSAHAAARLGAPDLLPLPRERTA